MRSVLPQTKSLALATFALAAMLSSGCASFFNSSPLPSPPAPLVACAGAAGVEITPGAKTRAEAARLLAEIRRSELSKGRCAADWLAWYQSLAESH